MTKMTTGLVQNARGGWATLKFALNLPVAVVQAGRLSSDETVVRDPVTGLFNRFLKTCKVSVTVEGQPPEPRQGCVISHNETSFADIAAYFIAVWPHVDRLAGADVYRHIPFSKGVYGKLAIEMVPRGNRAATEVLLRHMVAAVQRGERIGWGGEGRLFGQDGVGHFKVGGSLIAIRAQVPVVPVAIFGGHRAMRLGSIRACPGDIRIRFCKPIPTVGLTESDARGFADALRTEIARNYDDMAIGWRGLQGAQLAGAVSD